MSITRSIRAFICTGGEHHRYRTWEHCYRYFRSAARETSEDVRCHAALQLAFYLASWGMYRGSSFLLQYAYTVHLGVIDVLREARFSALWQEEFGAGKADDALVPTMLDACAAIEEAYRPFACNANSKKATDTLVTKVVLGTFGCLPACDQYFVKGFRHAGFTYSRVNAKFIHRILDFCHANLPDLRQEQKWIQRRRSVRYPLMKLVDMYFWQSGRELDGAP